MNRIALRAAPVVAVAAVVAVVASGSPATAKSTQRLSAVEKSGGKLAFSKKRITVSAGKVTIKLNNPKGNKFPHAIDVEGKGVNEDSQVITAGKSTSVTVRLKKGRTYEFFCPVANHKQLGMKGKIVVR